MLLISVTENIKRSSLPLSRICVRGALIYASQDLELLGLLSKRTTFASGNTRKNGCKCRYVRNTLIIITFCSAPAYSVFSVFAVHVCAEPGRKSEDYILTWPYATAPPPPSPTAPPNLSMQIQCDLLNNPQHLKSGFNRTSMTLHLLLGFSLDLGYFACHYRSQS